jgi:hypothetical protein
MPTKGKMNTQALPLSMMSTDHVPVLSSPKILSGFTKPNANGIKSTVPVTSRFRP